MLYRHSFQVRAEISAVLKFHMHSRSMAMITPPPIIVRIHRAPAILQNGDEMDFTLWLGPLPIHWQAQIEWTTANSFIDRQIRGPFYIWIHSHTFHKIDNHHTLIHDEVEATLKPHLIWRLVGASMWIGMPLLFAYRGWKTRRLLERQALDRQTTNQEPENASRSNG